MSKRRPERQRSAAATSVLPPLAERLHPLLLPAAVALLVGTHLIPSEAVAREGTHAVLCMAWCALLLAWGTVTAFVPHARLKFSWSDGALLLLIGLHTLSGLIPREGVITRATWNVAWLWISYGICAFLLRQLLTSAALVRAVLAVMLGLAICLASHAYYQYFVSMPIIRARLHSEPEKVLKEEGIPLDADSPVRQHFIDRVEAREPLATFALTNSLAGFLAPWLVIAAGLALTLGKSAHPKSLAAIVLAVAIALLGCLLLTKSRTALLAVCGGGVLLAIFSPTRNWKLDWRLPVAAGGVLVVLSLVAVAVGGLDTQVLSEAPKSVLYRLEYWRATAAMIGQYPVWGCGPGNFQDHFSHYKLPEASEVVADPHNVLLEVWSTAGTLALIALVVWMAALAADVGRASARAAERDPSLGYDAAADETSTRRVYVGAIAGIALGFGLSFLTVFPLWTSASGGHIAIGLIGLPLAGLFVWRLQPWVLGGPVSAALPAIALVTLLVNLLAAGAGSFPGVVSSAWVLAACAVVTAERHAPGWPLARFYLPALIVAPLFIGAACFWTEYSPVLRHQVLMHEAEQLLEPTRLRPVLVDKAIERLEAAALADPASSQPWEELAALHLQQWLAGRRESWDKFLDAADQWRQLRPASHRQWARRGTCFFQAHRHSQQPDHLRSAIEAYEEAVKRYPASAIDHAQLAWVYHQAGDAERAAQEAQVAIDLDARNPHDEFKLRRARLIDPQPESRPGEGWRMERSETAEQTLELIRKGLVRDS